MLKLILAIFFGILLVSTVLVILFDNGDPGRKIAWILIIAIVPVIGLILYLLMGLNLRHHWIYNARHRKYKEYFTENLDKQLSDKIFGDGAESLVRDDFRPLARLLARGERPSVSAGNDVELITTGSRKAELLLSDIAAAKEYIHIEYFHFSDDASGNTVMDLLEKKAREGVKVRFLKENIADFPIGRHYYDDMVKAGVEVLKFTNPRNHVLSFITRLNYRNHRKVVVIDGRVGYIGGMNINNHYFLQWKDTHLRLSGGVLAGLQQVFLDSWLTSGGTLDRPLEYYFKPVGEAVFPFEPGPDVFAGKLVQITPDSPEGAWKAIQMGYVNVLMNAKRYVWFQTPYFVPPEPVFEAMKAAALAGVDVRVMMPKKPDHFFMALARQSFYEDCLESGIKIYLRRGEFMHSKTIICDDYLCSIGSANIDNRSFAINYEANAHIYDGEVALRMKGLYEEELANCDEVCRETVDAFRWYERVGQRLTALAAPIL